MAVLPIVRLGHPLLRQPAEALTREQLASPEVQALIDNMIETMRDAGGVGLAAPQVAHGCQIFLYELASDDPELAIPLTVVVNPMVESAVRELEEDWEGCLSIPDLRGLVPRHNEVRVRALDRHGEALDFVAYDFEARIIQHEFDHLNGVIFLDRMRDFRSLAFMDEWRQYLASAEGDARDEAVE